MYDVVIIGSGPAGYAAALYTSRAFLKTLLLSGDQPGGQLSITTEVENYPGFAAGILGPELVEGMKKQVERFGTEIINDSISNIKPSSRAQVEGYQKSNIHIKDQIEKKQNTFLLQGESGRYEGKAVIIATGASAKRLHILSEEKFWGKGISACATCDGFFFRGKEVVVVGGGDTAMEEATFLTRFASRVTIIHRRQEFRASPIMLERARQNPKISFLTNKVIGEFLGDQVLSGVRLKDVVSGEISEFPTQGAFMAIGHQPNTAFLKGFLKLDEKGYVLVNRNGKRKTENGKSEMQVNVANPMLYPQTKTSVPGVFAAGDCADPRYRQAAVAAGMGVMAAIDAQKYLEQSVK